LGSAYARIRLTSLAASTLVLSLSPAVFAQCDRDKQQQAIAALGMHVKIQFDRYHIPSSIEGQIAPRSSGDPRESAVAALRALGDAYCVSDTDGFIASRSMLEPDELGQTDVPVHQTYRGIEVIGPGLRVHLTHDSVMSIRGWFRPGITITIDPVLTVREASHIALQHVAKRGGMNAAVQDARTPVVFVNDRNQPDLAYLVRVDYAVDSDNRYRGGRHVDDVFVNAITGAVVGVYPRIRRDP
jgi:Zn-dependent metalloprotease